MTGNSTRQRNFCQPISYSSRQRLPFVPVGFVAISPDLGIEIVSPSDTVSQMRQWVRELLETGVRLVWVVDRENRTLTIYRAGQPPRELTEVETVSGEDVLPGFACTVADLLP